MTSGGAGCRVCTSAQDLATFRGVRVGLLTKLLKLLSQELFCSRDRVLTGVAAVEGGAGVSCCPSLPKRGVGALSGSEHPGFVLIVQMINTNTQLSCASQRGQFFEHI